MLIYHSTNKQRLTMVSKLLGLCVLSSVIICNPVSAGEGWTLDLGGQIANTKIDYQPKNYNVKNKYATYGAFVGIRKNLTDNFSLGLELKQLFGIKANATYTSSRIDLTSDSTLLMLNSVYDINQISFYQIIPYCTAGAGISLNRTKYSKSSNFNNINYIYSESTKKTSYAYKIGFGLKTTINEKISIALGYEYIDLGKIQINNFNNKAKVKGNSLVVTVSTKL